MNRAKEGQGHPFEEGWMPSVLEEEVLIRGTYWYRDQVPHKARLVRRRLNYSASDVREYGLHIHELDWEHPYLSVNDDGDVFIWLFDEPSSLSSGSFSSASAAQEHMEGFDGRFELSS